MSDTSRSRRQILEAVLSIVQDAEREYRDEEDRGVRLIKTVDRIADDLLNDGLVIIAAEKVVPK